VWPAWTHFTFSEYFFVPLRAGTEASLALTVKVDVAAAVGLPEMTPALERVSPAGRLPAEIDHL
jgi:hypothetical protein